MAEPKSPRGSGMGNGGAPIPHGELQELPSHKKQALQPHPETTEPARLNLSLNFIYPSFAPRHNSCKHSSALGL